MAKTAWANLYDDLVTDPLSTKSMVITEILDYSYGQFVFLITKSLTFYQFDRFDWEPILLPITF